MPPFLTRKRGCVPKYNPKKKGADKKELSAPESRDALFEKHLTRIKHKKIKMSRGETMKYGDFYDYAKIVEFDKVALMTRLQKLTKVDLIEILIASLEFFEPNNK